METKICIQCGKDKPLTDFAVSFDGENAKNGFTQNKNYKHRCKLCYGLRDRLRLKMQFFAAYDNKCICCGEDDLRFLSLDHINNDGSKQKKELKLNEQQMYRLARQEGYLKDKYQVLCHNCNHGKYCNNGICPHKCMTKEEYKEKIQRELLYVGKQFVKTNIEGLKLGSQVNKPYVVRTKEQIMQDTIKSLSNLNSEQIKSILENLS